MFSQYGTERHAAWTLLGLSLMCTHSQLCVHGENFSFYLSFPELPISKSEKCYLVMIKRKYDQVSKPSFVRSIRKWPSQWVSDYPREILQLKLQIGFFNAFWAFWILIFVLCVWMFWVHLCLCTIYIPCATRSQKREISSLELELQMVKNHHVGAWNVTNDIWKSS
jgi:hypothetical protein